MIFFFFHNTATTEIYTLSLHDALPICVLPKPDLRTVARLARERTDAVEPRDVRQHRSEEHTSELQSRRDLVCRLLLEKKKEIDPAALDPSTIPPVFCAHAAEEIDRGG